MLRFFRTAAGVGGRGALQARSPIEEGLEASRRIEALRRSSHFAATLKQGEAEVGQLLERAKSGEIKISAVSGNALEDAIKADEEARRLSIY